MQKRETLSVRLRTTKRAYSVVPIAQVGMVHLAGDIHLIQAQLEECLLLELPGGGAGYALQSGEVLWLPLGEDGRRSFQTLAGALGLDMNRWNLDLSHQIRYGASPTDTTEELPF